jgi:putative transposase
MKWRKFTDEQIVAIVKEGEAGRKVADVCRANGITEQTYHRWRAKYGGLELGHVQRLRHLGYENRRLKQIVDEQMLDLQAMRAVVALDWLRFADVLGAEDCELTWVKPRPLQGHNVDLPTGNRTPRVGRPEGGACVSAAGY